MSALTPKADDQHGVKRLVPRRNGHQMGTWAELGTIEAGRIRPNLLIRIGGQGRADSRSESGARQFGMEAELDAGAKPVCPKGEVQDAPSQPTGAQRGQESAHADSTHKFAGSEFGYAKHTPRLQRKNGLNQSTTDTRIFSPVFVGFGIYISISCRGARCLICTTMHNVAGLIRPKLTHNGGHLI